MKKVVFTGLVCLFMASVSTAVAQSNVFISNDVLKTAEWASFKYKDVVKKAIGGDKNSLQKLFEFSRYVDGVEGLDHAVTCLEIIPLATDRKAAEGVAFLKPNLQKIVLSRIVQAQGRTKKTDLQKPMTEWAPITWNALNGKGLPETVIDEATKAEKLRQSDAAQEPGKLKVAPVDPKSEQKSRQ